MHDPSVLIVVLNVPAGQAVHTVLDVVVQGVEMKDPAAQLLQFVHVKCTPAVAMNVLPAMQLGHCWTLVRLEAVPAGHMAQVRVDVAVHSKKKENGILLHEKGVLKTTKIKIKDRNYR